jgi:CHAD domain-containing protein
MEMGYRLLAAKFIRTQAKQLRAQFDGIRDTEDIEYVHHARVASRRLRAGMRIFGECFSRKKVKQWKKAIRRICSELGDARDKDVQIEFLREILASLDDKSCIAGISRLLIELEYQRECMQNDVVRSVMRLKGKSTLKKVENAAKCLLATTELPEGRVEIPESFARAEVEILDRLNKFLSLQDCLQRPDDRQGHHAMRIAAKRLRYTLEIAGPIYHGQSDCFVEAIKKIQTLLGEIHDCDVWHQKLDQFTIDQRARIKSCYGHPGPFNRLNAGIEYLRQDRLRWRKQCFEELVRLWDDLDNQEIWENLVGVVQSRGIPLDEPELSKNDNSIEESPETIKEIPVDQVVAENDTGGNGEQKASSVPSPTFIPA